MKLCRHDSYTTVDWIWEPKYSTDEILLDKDKIDRANEHLIIKFTHCNKYPDWFYMAKKMVKKHRIQSNGRGKVYVVPMKKREPFIGVKQCEHMNMELF